MQTEIDKRSLTRLERYAGPLLLAPGRVAKRHRRDFELIAGRELSSIPRLVALANPSMTFLRPGVRSGWGLPFVSSDLHICEQHRFGVRLRRGFVPDRIRHRR